MFFNIGDSSFDGPHDIVGFEVVTANQGDFSDTFLYDQFGKLFIFPCINQFTNVTLFSNFSNSSG